MRSKGSTDLANGRIVDGEFGVVELRPRVSVAAPKRFAPLADEEMVDNFDEADSCGETEDQAAILPDEIRKRGGDRAEICDAIQSGEV